MQDGSSRNPSPGGGGFFRGVGAALGGFGSAMANREVRAAYLRLVLALVAASVVIGAAMIYGLWAIPEPSGDAFFLWRWLLGLGLTALRVVGVVIVLFAAPVVALFAVNIIFPLFAESVFFAGLRRIDPERAQVLEARPGLPLVTSIRVLVRVLLHFVFLTLLAMLSVLIPIVGPIVAPIFQAWVTAKTLGWELLDPYLDKQEMLYPAQKEYVNRNSMAITGFGMPYSFLFAIPFIGPLFFGLGQAAAPMLLVQILEPSGRAPIDAR